MAGREEPLLQKTASGVPNAPALSSLKVNQDFGRIPLYFIANKGQAAARVNYYIQGKDKTIYFTSEGLTYVLNGRSAEDGKDGSRDLRNRPLGKEDNKLQNRTDWVMKLDFVGANSNVHPSGEEKTEAVISYFKGKPEEWKTGVPTYSRIIYRDLWPGIDLAYFGTQDRLKYEFIVHPGADPSRIRLAYSGINDLEVNGEGRLEVRTPVGVVEDDSPEGYQEADGKRVEVALRYRLEGSGINKIETPESAALNKSHIYGFEVGEYDRTRPLVLDPAVLIYCGYIGGSGDDFSYGIAVDGSGNAYVTGSTVSTQATFPVTVGPDLIYDDYGDAFVAKVNSAGTALIYCGYIGGSDTDSGHSIAVDGYGSAYVTGMTTSTQATFPLTVGPDLTFNGGLYDAFVAKVNSTGTALMYCGYIGGLSSEQGRSIAVDGSGNAYVTGYTYSTQATFPVAVGPDLTYNGGGDAFVAKINSAGTALIYCGYIGGSGDDGGEGLAVDGSGNAYVTGSTESTQATFPVIVGPADLTYNGGYSDAFVAKVNSTGTALFFCGYIGGSDDDRGYSLAVDGSGNAYITGTTESTQSTFPVTVGPDLTYNGLVDTFVAKVNSTGTALLYCSYIGGSGDDRGYGIAVDSSGNAYVTGYTSSTQATFPVTIGPDLTYNGGNFDAFVAKVNSAGTALLYCGYIGGSDWDIGYGIAADVSGNAYVAGITGSTEATFPVTVGPDLTHNDYWDAFVAKVNFTISAIYTLTIAAGTGGTTNPVPGSYTYDAGTQATITAFPSTNYRFLNWSGSVTGASNPVNITMDEDKTVTANFQRIIYAPSNATGQQVLNRSFSQAEYINVLTWSANANNVNITSYKIYLVVGGQKTALATITADKTLFTYWHRKVTRGQEYTYQIVAVNNEPREGDPATVVVR